MTTYWNGNICCLLRCNHIEYSILEFWSRRPHFAPALDLTPLFLGVPFGNSTFHPTQQRHNAERDNHILFLPSVVHQAWVYPRRYRPGMKRQYPHITQQSYTASARLPSDPTPDLLRCVFEHNTHEFRHEKPHRTGSRPGYAFSNVYDRVLKTGDQEDQAAEEIPSEKATFTEVEEGVREPGGWRRESLPVDLVPEVTGREGRWHVSSCQSRKRGDGNNRI